MGIRVLYPHTATYHNFVRTAEQKWICDLQKCGDFMTYKEAADRIEEHAHIHYRQEYPRANLITEALQMAVKLLREKAIAETGFMADPKFIDNQTLEITMRPVCECGYVFSELSYNRRSNMFAPYICPNCKKPITTLRCIDISKLTYDESGDIKFCE